MNWVRWNVVSQNKKEGGVGIGNVLDYNRGLMSKWIWRYYSGPDTLWKKVIRAKYEITNGSTLGSSVRGRNGSHFIKSMQKLVGGSDKYAKAIQEGFGIAIGRGDLADFWDHKWEGDINLKTMVPRIYALASNRVGSIDKFGRWHGFEWEWNINLRRGLFRWETGQWNVLWEFIKGIRLNKERPDRIIWKGNPNGVFTVNSFCKTVEEVDSRVNLQISPTIAKVWNSSAPPKVEMFLWQLLVGRIPTKDSLLRLGIIEPSSARCIFGCGDIETVDHLFLHCGMMWRMWAKVLDLWGVYSAVPSSLRSWWDIWPSLCPENRFTEAWSTAFYATVWSVWLERNRLCFKGGSFCEENLVQAVKLSMGWWLKSKEAFSGLTINDILLNLKEACSHTRIPKLPNRAVWRRPPAGMWKLNIDGASRGNPGPAGVAGGIRDDQGSLKGVFSIPIGSLDSNTAELRALLEGINLILVSDGWRLKPIIIESDSKTIVSWIEGVNPGPWMHQQMMNEIGGKLSRIREETPISIVHILRGANNLADFLAKGGVDRTSPLIACF